MVTMKNGRKIDNVDNDLYSKKLTVCPTDDVEKTSYVVNSY